MTLARSPKRHCAKHTLFRPRLEHLEDRAVPATFNVTTSLDVVDPTDGKRSLREAITAANNLAGADVIVVPAGVYKLALAGANENANTTGDFDVTGAVTIRGAGAGLTIIDGQQLDRVFDVFGTAPGSIAVVLEKATVRNGSVVGHGGGIQVVDADLLVRDSAVNGNRASETGGGVSNGSSAGTGDVKVVRTTVGRNVAGTNGGGLGVFGSSLLTVKDCTIRGNVASDIGGGIATNTVTLTNCTVNGNRTATNGGGIFAGTATLTNCTVSGNSSGLNGGGIQADTTTLSGSNVSGNSTEGRGGGLFGNTATVTRSTLTSNVASLFGGGINALTATVTDSTVSGNTASTDGGGIFADMATLTKSTVSGNTASERGGGINATTVTLTNSTVSGNSAAIEGGGLFATTATLLNCTIVENVATTGGGLFHVAGGTFSVKNTIVALNLVAFGGIGPEAFGASFTSQGHNLIGDGAGSTGFTNGVNGDIVGTGAIPIDPKLGPLANNGGRTKTHALKAGSRAIDRGDNAGVPPTDQRGFGFPRNKDGNGDGIARVDIGAYER